MKYHFDGVNLKLYMTVRGVKKNFWSSSISPIGRIDDIIRRAAVAYATEEYGLKNLQKDKSDPFHKDAAKALYASWKDSKDWDHFLTEADAEVGVAEVMTR